MSDRLLTTSPAVSEPGCHVVPDEPGVRSRSVYRSLNRVHSAQNQKG